MDDQNTEFNEIPTLNPLELQKSLNQCYENNIVPIILSSAGNGKSEIVTNFSKEKNLELITFNLSTIQVEDLSGIPTIKKDLNNNFKTKFIPPNILPLEGDLIPNNKDGFLLFLDELTNAQEDVLAATYSILWDRKILDFILHKKTFIVAAGNTEESSTLAKPLPYPIINRTILLNLHTSLKDWIDYEILKPHSQTFINFLNSIRVDDFFTSPEDYQQNQPIRSPRSLTLAHNILKNYLFNNPNNKSEIELLNVIPNEIINVISGLLGKTFTSSFEDFYKNKVVYKTLKEIVEADKNEIFTPPNTKSMLINQLDFLRDQLISEIEKNGIDILSKKKMVSQRLINFFKDIHEQEKTYFYTTLEINLENKDFPDKNNSQTKNILKDFAKGLKITTINDLESEYK